MPDISGGFLTKSTSVLKLGVEGIKPILSMPSCRKGLWNPFLSKKKFKSDPTKKVRLHEDNPVELSSGDILHFGLPGVSNVTKEYNPPIITILKLQHPLKVGKKDMKEYDDYGNELSPSLLKMYK